ncbi:CocE/NonD family hydrolase [Actinomadura rudentiformis]|uniref:CocE/NonD family hydrolase n=1 Tax=Actinomadura rudentiformis TaxID=359158 RepID=A0A6H9YV65_9ACTN|nr:CocE/NonD family hydrolase [Actinomadura rudentiformis]KAB2352527.1 CocE/NonD family hydrolase [Actinomadura rudentiformis]
MTATMTAALAAVTAGPAPAGAATPPSAGVLNDPFFTYDRPAQYGVSRSDVRVPVRDGSFIACDLYRPGGSEGPAAGRHPGLILDYTAYADQAESFGVQATYFAQRGYNGLVCATRGSGESPGRVDPFGPQEQRDNYDVIEWLAAQPWSTGSVGQMGVSYGGHSSLLVAVNQPPHLKAIIPVNGLHDWYENTIYRGGIYSPRIRPWQQSVAPDTLTTYAEHPLYDRFWQDRSVKSRKHRLTAPTLEINGWYDRYRDGMVKNYLAGKDNVWLVSGPWRHGYPAKQYADIGPGAYLAWWDRWLRDDPAAPLPKAKITSYETPGPGAGAGWRQYPDWPPPGARALRLAFTRNGGLDRAPGRPGAATFTVNTEQTPAAPDERLLFETGPLRRDLVLAGDIETTVKASFTARDGNIAIVVSDVAPDGTATRVTEGWLKASHRHGHRRPVPVVPGLTSDLRVHVWPTHYRLKSGHRLRITVSSDDHPEIDSDAPGGRVGLTVGAGGSYAELTVLPAP